MTWERFSYCEIRGAVLTPNERTSVIEQHKTASAGNGQISGSRNCNLWWIDQPAEVIAKLHAVASECYPDFELSHFQGKAQLTQYGPGQRYDWHMDFGPGPMSRRKISLVAELASAKAGGGLEVFFGEGPNNRLHLRPGDVALFPSWIMHRAVPVTDGERWSLVIWLLGDQALR